MKLNRKWIMVLALVMSIAMATTGTLAYLTDRDSEVNTFTVGDVSIDLEEVFEQESELIPGVDIQKEATIKNTGKNDAWVWLTVLLPEEMGPHTAPDNMSATYNVVHWNYPDAVKDKITVDFNPKPVAVDTDGDGATESYYQTNMLWNSILEAGDTTDIMISKVYMDTHVDIDPDGNMYWVENGVATDLNWNIKEKGNPVIHVSAYAIQSEGLKDMNGDSEIGVKDAYILYNQQWGNNGAEYGEPQAPIEMPTTSWAASTNTSWYSADATEYTIDTAEELAGLAELVNEGVDFSDKKVTLTANIDLGDNLWVPIGQPGARYFKGTFDGGNYTISNLFVNDTTCEFAGLFGGIFYTSDWTKNPATVKNVVVKNAEINAKENAGVIVGFTYGNVVDCTVENAVITVLEGKAGSIVGGAASDSADIVVSRNTASNVTITDRENKAGAIIGRIWEQGNCTVSDNSFSNITINGAAGTTAVGITQ